MGYAEHLHALIRPLKVYKPGGYAEAGMTCLGGALDAVDSDTSELERESLPGTARSWGLDLFTELVRYFPTGGTAAKRRTELCAILGMPGRGLSLSAINEALAGCGTEVLAEEADTPNTVRISFPGQAGTPDDFDRISALIEAILPCHLTVEYDID